MQKQGVVLIVNANKGLLTSLSILLQKNFLKVIPADTPEDVRGVLGKENIDVVVWDVSTSSSKETDAGLVKEIKERSPETELVLLAAFADINRAVEGVRQGAFDFVVKPWNNEKLIISVRNALMVKKYKKALIRMTCIKDGLQEVENYFWGISPVMQRLYHTVHKIAGTDMPVLISGEYGAGKEALAKEIHFISQRRDAFFAKLDLDVISDDLFGRELFGCVKGTDGALSDQTGKMGLAQDGTLFINHIEKLSLSNQLILLNIINTNRYNKIGCNIFSEASVRWICSTGPDPGRLVKQGLLNEELYNKINTVQIFIPSLGERRDDILPLAKMTLDRYARKYNKPIAGFTTKAGEVLENYSWKGNVSELAATIEKAVIASPGEMIAPEHLSFDWAGAHRAEGVADETILERETLGEMEKRAIRTTLAKNGGNMTLTAAQLGVTRQTLYNKGKKYRLIE